MGGRSAVGVVALVWAGTCAGGREALAAGVALAAASVLALLAACAMRAASAHAAASERAAARGAGAMQAGSAMERSDASRIADLALAVALVLAGVARGAAHRDVLVHQRASLGPGLHRIEARVIEPPLRESGMPSATVRILASAPPLVAGSRMRLWLPPGSTAEWGDRIAAMVQIDPPGPPRNPGGHDARASANAAAIVGWGRALQASVLDSTSWSSWPRATCARWRRAIEARFARRLSPEAREIVTPLVVGDRTALSSELDAAFRAAGVVHLLALSGLHVSWMAGVGRAAIATLGGGVRTRALAGAVCALLYMGLAGPLPSLARAVATELFVAGAVLARRALDPVQALALSALAGLVVAPGWAGDLGFQLSCAATLGLVTIGTGLAERAGRWRRALDLILPTASAQITALPLLLARLHVVSWVAPLTNLLAVPISGLLLAAAWLGAVWEIALPGSARPAFAACEALVAALRAVTELGARLPSAALSTGGDVAPAFVAAIGAALVAYALVPRVTAVELGGALAVRRLAGAIVGASFLLAALIATCAERPLAPRAGSAWIVVLDVGQGDAIALAMPDGWWLIDAGPKSPRGDAGERYVLPFLRWAGVRTLTGLVLTHDDADHTGGAGAVSRAVRVYRTFVPPTRPGVRGSGALSRGVPVARGDTLARWPEVDVVWPPREVPESWSDNRAGLVLMLSFDSTRALLTADVDTLAERALETGPIAVLKVAHHGSRTSTASELLERTRPMHAVISCGRRNRYGHPHPDVLARLTASGARIHRTDDSGAIWLELDADGVRVVDWRRHGAPRESSPPCPAASSVARLPRAHPRACHRRSRVRSRLQFRSPGGRCRAR